MSDSPSFTDGRRSVKNAVLLNLNILVASAPLPLHYIDDSLQEAGQSLDHTLEGEGEHLGSDTKASGCLKGVINAQLDKATTAMTRVGHVLQLTKNGAAAKFFVVESIPQPMKRNDVVRIAPTVKQVMNPFFKGLLSEDEGDTRRLTYSKAAIAGSTEDIATSPVNHRTGATKAYTATQSDGTALPTGLAINASTGVLTITKATIASSSWTIVVVATDTLTNKRDRDGEGTLVLTVTA